MFPVPRRTRRGSGVEQSQHLTLPPTIRQGADLLDAWSWSGGGSFSAQRQLKLLNHVAAESHPRTKHPLLFPLYKTKLKPRTCAYA